METKETLQEIIKKANETKALQDKIIAEAEENLKKVGKKKLRPDYNEWYFCLDRVGEISSPKHYSEYDENVWSSGNGFFTKEEAEKELAKRQAIQRVKDYLIENDLLCSEEEVNAEGYVKYFIKYDTRIKELVVGQFFYQKYYSPFGYSRNTQFLEDCKEDLLLIFG